jgi:hypothetical protein
MKPIATILLLVSAAACAATPAAEPAPAPPPPAPMAAPAPAAPAALNPVGRYEFATTVNGSSVTRTLEITGTPGAYAGRLTSTATEPITVSSATVEGQTMTVTAETGTGTLTIHMTFAADGTFTGNWALSGDGAPLTGRRTS